jgi:hypothetical protein
MNIEINIFSTLKGFEECVGEEAAQFAIYKSKKYIS